MNLAESGLILGHRANGLDFHRLYLQLLSDVSYHYYITTE